MKIGVLALQGAFIEHIKTLSGLGVAAIAVRLPDQLVDLDGLIIPGGESTAMGQLLETYALTDPIRQLIRNGLPLYGTCAGLILLARNVGHDAAKDGQPLLAAMDIHVDRNAFGRQLQSFQQDISIPVLGEQPFPAVFIRAPAIRSVGEGVEILAQLNDTTIVAARQRHLLVTAFHPELSLDTRMHRYFLSMCEHQPNGQGSV